MESAIEILSFVRFGAYFGATGAFAQNLLKPSKRTKSIALTLLWTGFAIGSLILVLRAWETGAFPLFTRFDTLGLFAWAVTLAFLLTLVRAPVEGLGAVMVPVPTLALVLALKPPTEEFSVPEGLGSPWLGAHLLLFFVAYSALLLGFGFGVLYLILERQLKLKKLSGIFYKLPPLVDLDRVLGRAEAWGFVCLTAGIMTGIYGFWNSLDQVWAWDPKVIAILFTWGLYALYLGLKFFMGWGGKRTAIFSVVGFTCVLVSYLGIGLIHPGHGTSFF